MTDPIPNEVNILVVGATGKQGGSTLSSLLLDSPSSPNQINLRFLTRNPTSQASKNLIEKGIKAYKGDLGDVQSLKNALKGVQGAFLITDALSSKENEVQHGLNFINAAKKMGVKHVVYTSIAAAELDIDVEHWKTKVEIEKALINSGLTYTILRPVAFMDNFPAKAGFPRYLGTPLFYSATNFSKIQLISTEDIGVFAAKALSNPDDHRFRNKKIQLSSGSYGLDDISKAIYNTQGYKPWFASWIPKLIRNIFPADFKRMTIFFETTGFPETDIDYLKSIHPGLMSLEDYYRKNGS